MTTLRILRQHDQLRSVAKSFFFEYPTRIDSVPVYDQEPSLISFNSIASEIRMYNSICSTENKSLVDFSGLLFSHLYITVTFHMFLDIVGDHGLRRVCLQFIRASYDILHWLSSTFPVRSVRISWGIRTEIVGYPHTLSGARAIP